MHKQFNLFITMLLALVLGVGCGKSGDTDKSLDVLKKEAEAAIGKITDADVASVSSLGADAEAVKKALNSMLNTSKDDADSKLKEISDLIGAATGTAKPALEKVKAVLEKIKVGKGKGTGKKADTGTGKKADTGADTGAGSE